MKVNKKIIIFLFFLLTILTLFITQISAANDSQIIASEIDDLDYDNMEIEGIYLKENGILSDFYLILTINNNEYKINLNYSQEYDEALNSILKNNDGSNVSSKNIDLDSEGNDNKSDFYLKKINLKKGNYSYKSKYNNSEYNGMSEGMILSSNKSYNYIEKKDVKTIKDPQYIKKGNYIYKKEKKIYSDYYSNGSVKNTVEYDYDKLYKVKSFNTKPSFIYKIAYDENNGHITIKKVGNHFIILTYPQNEKNELKKIKIYHKNGKTKVFEVENTTYKKVMKSKNIEKIKFYFDA